jgi:hypothetical protein
MKVPLLDLKAEYAELREDILPALDRVCQNSAFVHGEEVEAFEREFADFCGTRTGTAALHPGPFGARRSAKITGTLTIFERRGIEMRQTRI